MLIPYLFIILTCASCSGSVTKANPPIGGQPDPGPPVAVEEICNDADDDLDMRVDETFRVGDNCLLPGLPLRCGHWACVEEGDSIGGIECKLKEGLEEVYDGIDNDCDGQVDEAWDRDEDGFAFNPSTNLCDDCDPALNPDCVLYCARQDCMDVDVQIHPGVIDECGDGVDEDCDGVDATCELTEIRLSEIRIAPHEDERCPDISGDGEPNHEFGLFETSEEKNLADSLFPFLMMKNFEGRADRNISMGMLFGARGERGGEPFFVLGPGWLDDDLEPLVQFSQTFVREGGFFAGPTDFTFTMNVIGVEISLPIQDARLTALVTERNWLIEGVLWGVVQRENLMIALDRMLEWCDGRDPRPSTCSTLESAGEGALDLIQNDYDFDRDGTLDSASICFLVKGVPDELEGYPVQ